MPQTIAPVPLLPRPERADDGDWKRRRPVGWFTSDRSPTSYPKPLLPRPARVYEGGLEAAVVPPVGTHRPGPQGANTAGHRAEIFPLNMPQDYRPQSRSSPGPKGLMMGTESGGDPSDGPHLTGPQPVIPSRSSPDPRGSMRGSGGGGGPAGWYTPARSPRG